MPLLLLPFLGSGFVPTDSMPAGDALVRRAPALHADHGDAARAADGHADRQRGSLAVAWCVAIALGGYVWAKRLYNRDPTP